MPTIVFASSKGGAGKTTAATVLASELARQGIDKDIGITLIDADPNQHSAKWALKDGCPKNINLVPNINEETILDTIDEAETKNPFVLVDLEGTASTTVTYATSRADLVIIPCQGSQDDADEAAKTINLIFNSRRLIGRNIPFSVLLTRTHPAIIPKGLKFIINEFKSASVDMFRTSLIDREAFRTVRSFGGTVNDLTKSDVSGAEKAAVNAEKYAYEVMEKLEYMRAN
ncbi:MAG: AAA family ATPase [Aliifodinibius sp.]|nr:ParA family protein [Fodinibius sp.]NIY26969.1 AAA family ATPase [Fodinibius sp.]